MMQGPSSSTNLPRVPVARLAGHDGPVQAIVFTSDGKWCLTGGLDRTVKLWNPFRVDPQYTAAIAAKSSESLRSKTRGPPPREAMKMTTGTAAFQDLPPALNIQTYSGGLTHDISALCVTSPPSLSPSSSQTLLAACDKTMVVTDLISNQVKRRLGQHHHTGRINAVAATTQYGGEAYVTASYDATVAIWDGRSRDTKPLQVLKDAKDSVTSVYIQQQTSSGGAHNSSSSVKDYSNNIAIIRTASVDGIVRTYDLRKGLLQCDDFGSPVTSMARTKDGNCLVVSCLDGTIRLMELETGELLNTYNSHHTAGQYGLDVDVLADDATIVTGSENGACALYDLVRANMVQVLDGPARRPTCTVAAHPKQSSVVVAASYDNSTVVWSHDNISWQEQLDGDDEVD